MTTLTPGQEIGPYRVIEQVGKGGMATVYKAHHAKMDRFVAIKILPFQFAQDKEFNERFQREVRVIARLEHPRILPVYDSGDFQGTPYLVMRYLDAGTLKERIETGKLSLNEIDRIFTQLADALAYAHQHDIVHRDIKPSNVMLTRQGDVFLTDFGIAKLVGENTQFTASGAITGTPAYMSPEQAEGSSIDARADIYALGIVLYEMVTGRVPYEAETPLAVILKHLQAPLPPPSTVADVHPAIEQVILKTLAKNRDDRYASVNDLLAAWKRATEIVQSEKSTQAGKQSPLAALETIAVRPTPVQPAGASAAPPRPTSTPPTPSPRRGKMLWIGGGVAGLFVLALCVWGAFALFRTCCAPEPSIPSDETSSALSEESGPVSLLPFPQADSGEWEAWTGAGTVYAVAFSDGLIYAGGRGGITVYDTEGEVQDQFTVQDGLPDNDVYSLFIDKEGDGNLWAGTEAGLVRYDGEEWILYDHEDGLDNDTIFFVGRVGDQIAAGTAYAPDGGGVNFFDGSGWWQPEGFDSTSADSADQFSNKVWNVALDPNSGEVWVATENGLGLYDWESSWTRFTTENGLPSNFVTGLFFNDENTLIVATENGAAWFDGSSFIPFDPTVGNSINGFVQDDEGRYWFSGSGGIWAFNPGNGNWQYYEGNNQFPTYTAFRSTKDDNGVLYFGTDALGVIRFDGQFSRIPLPAGPLQPATWGILEGPQGKLWFNEEWGDKIDNYDSTSDTWTPINLDYCCVVPMTFDAEGR
ncbi:MAG TPA: protein kinase, partial [Anaerolineales bacterium]|nr:protein kinase [Anaerolineales bacterium]